MLSCRFCCTVTDLKTPFAAQILLYTSFIKRFLQNFIFCLSKAKYKFRNIKYELSKKARIRSDLDSQHGVNKLWKKVAKFLTYLGLLAWRVRPHRSVEAAEKCRTCSGKSPCLILSISRPDSKIKKKRNLRLKLFRYLKSPFRFSCTEKFVQKIMTSQVPKWRKREHLKKNWLGICLLKPRKYLFHNK